MKRITFGLSIKEIRKAQAELKAYSKSLQRKCVQFVERLGEYGIEVATRKAGDNALGKYLLFQKEVTASNTKVRAVMYGTQTGLIRSEWYTNNNASGVEAADVSPLLMAEFGAGVKHDKNPKAHELGMGAGTFPGQTHAMNAEGWWYIPVNNPDGSLNTEMQWYWSDGIEPSMPMYTAAIEMHKVIVKIAREVFGT